MEKQKKIAIINDISSIGKCSSTVALPIISACGFESVPLVTSVFSAHTGFENSIKIDNTDYLENIVEHWKNLEIRFDCICTGYIANEKQAEIIHRFMMDFKKSDTVCIVDPVMGDNGKFYSGINGTILDEMRFMCSLADIIVPNVTEAELLTGTTCAEKPYDLEHIKKLLLDLRNIGAAKIVITGVDLGDNQIGCALYDSITGKANMFFTPKINGNYSGAGDVFVSALTAAVMSGKDFTEAVQLAESFTFSAIQKTAQSGSDGKFGLLFEPQICDFVKAVKR